MYDERQPFDSDAWDKYEQHQDDALRKQAEPEFADAIEALVTHKCGRPATHGQCYGGAFNLHHRIHLEGEDPSSDLIIRLPWPFGSNFTGEKILYEAAITKCLRLNTHIPTPEIIHYSRDSDIGPFILFRFIENKGDMTDPLAVPGRDYQETPLLNPELSDSKLQSLWGGMAWCLLELAKPTFPRIGSLLEVDGSLQVAGRPLTINMATMTTLANIPDSIFPLETDTYATADEWYRTLANMHLSQLIFQHNDLIFSENDCRNKYVARQLFRRLAQQGRLSTFGFAEDDWSAQSKQKKAKCPAPDGSGSFHLWCDDLRPANMLIDENDEIVAAVDWEFTYAAPTQFMLDPPWWLIFEKPETWPTTIYGWGEAYLPELKKWLRIMEEKEKEREGGAAFLNDLPLSAYMRESWNMGRFWLNYAAKKSWAFDAVFWTHLDERFFGDQEDGVVYGKLWETRLHLLTEEERNAMEPFVRQKMKESEERKLVDWEPSEARRRFSELLFD